MFLGIYISNKIGTEAIGVYGLIMSVYTLFITLASSGINLATSRIISEAIAYENEDEIHTATKKCIIYSFITGFTSFIILFLFSNLISQNWLHSKVGSIPLRLIALSLPFLSINSCLNGYFTTVQKVKFTILAQIVEQAIQIFIIVFLFNRLSPTSIEFASIILVLGITISEFISFIILYFLYSLEKKNKSVRKFKDIEYTKQILRITVPISITSYIRSGLSTLKHILIPNSLEKSGISCEQALSQYGIINGMVMPLILFPCLFISSFSMLLIPEFSYLNAKKKYDKINLAINKILKFSFIFSFLIMGIFWCFSYELSNVIYNKSNIGYYIKILSPLIILMYIDNIVDSILKGLDKQVLVMIINIVDLFTSIVCIYFIVPLYGIKGYILVLYISEFLNGLISLILLINATGLKLNFSNWLIKPLLCVFICNSIFKNFISNNVFNLILHILLFSICYLIISTLLKSIVKNDFKI